MSPDFYYHPSPVSTASGMVMLLINGTGSRGFTNRFGTSTTTPLTISPAGTDLANKLLYLSGTPPVDQAGVVWNLTSPVGLPGQGPSTLSSYVGQYRDPTGVEGEAGASLFDGTGQAFSSTVPTSNSVAIPADVHYITLPLLTLQQHYNYEHGYNNL